MYNINSPKQQGCKGERSYFCYYLINEKTFQCLYLLQPLAQLSCGVHGVHGLHVQNHVAMELGLDQGTALHREKILTLETVMVTMKR